jgi:hypothetical protein
MGAKAQLSPGRGPVQSFFYRTKGMSPTEEKKSFLLSSLNAKFQPDLQPPFREFLKKGKKFFRQEIGAGSQGEAHHGKILGCFLEGPFDFLFEPGNGKVGGGVTLKVENRFLCLETIYGYGCPSPNLFFQGNSLEEGSGSSASEITENTSSFSEIFPVRATGTQVQGYLVNPSAELLPEKGGPFSVERGISQEKHPEGAVDECRAFPWK